MDGIEGSWSGQQPHYETAELNRIMFLCAKKVQEVLGGARPDKIKVTVSDDEIIGGATIEIDDVERNDYGEPDRWSEGDDLEAHFKDRKRFLIAYDTVVTATGEDNIEELVGNLWWFKIEAVD